MSRIFWRNQKIIAQTMRFRAGEGQDKPHEAVLTAPARGLGHVRE
jgi:hypothetical protein